MSTDITPGSYIIHSRALDVNGNKLAITYENQSQAVQVQPLNSSLQQVVCAVFFNIRQASPSIFTVVVEASPNTNGPNHCSRHQQRPST